MLQGKAVLVRIEGRDWELVDLSRLKPEKARLVADAAARDTEEKQSEHEVLLNKVRARLDAVGLKQPSVLVRFKTLTVTAAVGVGEKGIPTLKSQILGLPQMVKRTVVSRRGRQKTSILNSVSGILEPGRLTLLLGPPGAGKTTLLKTLAGQMRHEPRLKVTYEELTFNGSSFDSFVPERTAAYISEIDLHYAQLTVRETLDFSARCQGVGALADILDAVEGLEKEQGITPDPDTAAFMKTRMAVGKHNLVTSIMLRVLGLEHVAETVIGGPMLRGVSGGQRKRVTTGEAVVGPVRVAFADAISTGLDSATTADITRAFLTFVRMLDATVLVALLQPPPETYELFDDVMLLVAGTIVFHGRREDVLPFFQKFGFECPERTAEADFLQDVGVLSEQNKYWSLGSQSFEEIPPVMMAETFYADHPTGREIVAALDKPFQPDSHTSPLDALTTKQYGGTNLYLLRCLMSRGWTLQKRQLPFFIIRFFQTVLTAFVVGTLFLREGKSSVEDGQLFLGVSFFSMLYMMVGAFPDGAMLVEMLPTFYKQRDAKFFPAWTFAATMFFERIPWLIVDATVWSSMVYWMVGFVSSVRFLVFWGTNIIIAIFGLSLFQAVASICRVQTTASAIESFVLLILLNTSGFVIDSRSIPGGWKGAFWANPWSYWLRGLAINELTSSDWNTPVPGSSMTLGDAVLTSRGFQTEYKWVWIGMFAWFVPSVMINFTAMVLACRYLTLPKPAPILSEEALYERQKSRLGSSAVLPPSSSTPEGLTLKSKSGKMPVTDDDGSVDPEKGVGPSTVSPQDNEFKGTKLPFTPLVLTFSDLNYSVPAPKGTEGGELTLLKGINGSFRPGVLTALMGASGAGKTTLMDVLAGRKTGGTITGRILVNGQPKDQKAFARVSGYVEQEDVHQPHATVEEALRFSASLRLPNSVSNEAAHDFVNEVMDVVELTKIARSSVGLPGQGGLSVEQRKRLTLAVELVANPAIIFLDEPTSGLDARAASIVMTAIRNTVSFGRTVVCTIHQPSFAIFAVFDELLLLKRGGETVYNGPLGPGAERLISYLSAIPGVAPVKPRTNPADWMLTVTSPEAEASTGINFSEAFRQSEESLAALNVIEKLSEPNQNAPPPRFEDLDVAPIHRQFLVLLLRNLRSYARNLSYNLTRLVISIVIGICYGTLYRNQGSDVSSYGAVLNIAGALYSSVLFLGIIDCLMVQDVTSVNRRIYYREHAAGTYSCLAYSLAEGIVELPYLLGQSILYSIIVYWSIGFAADAGKFFWSVICGHLIE